MGYTINSIRTNTRFKESDKDAMLHALRSLPVTDELNIVLKSFHEVVENASTLDEVASAYNITLVEDNDNRYVRPHLCDSYRSLCFNDVVECIAPFMEDGSIEGYAPCGAWKVVFSDHKGAIYDNYEYYLSTNGAAHINDPEYDPYAGMKLQNKDNRTIYY